MKKTFIVLKNRWRIFPQGDILKSNDMRGIFFIVKETKQSLKNITAAEAVVLNNRKIYATRKQRYAVTS